MKTKIVETGQTRRLVPVKSAGVSVPSASALTSHLWKVVWDFRSKQTGGRGKSIILFWSRRHLSTGISDFSDSSKHKSLFPLLDVEGGRTSGNRIPDEKTETGLETFPNRDR